MECKYLIVIIIWRSFELAWEVEKARSPSSLSLPSLFLQRYSQKQVIWSSSLGRKETKMATNPNTRDFPNSYFKEIIDYQEQQNLTQACETYLQTFQFPVFELLLVLQVKTTWEKVAFLILLSFKVLFPVLYAFMIPCISSFCIECYTDKIQDDEQVRMVWTKTSTILMGSWAHW